MTRQGQLGLTTSGELVYAVDGERLPPPTFKRVKRAMRIAHLTRQIDHCKQVEQTETDYEAMTRAFALRCGLERELVMLGGGKC